MAVWALDQLSDQSDFAQERARRLPREEDASVREEWQLGGGPGKGEPARL